MHHSKGNMLNIILIRVPNSTKYRFLEGGGEDEMTEGWSFDMSAQHKSLYDQQHGAVKSWAHRMVQGYLLG